MPAIDRYNKLYQYFKPTLQEMEDYWWQVIPPNLRTFFQSSANIELYAKNNKDQFYAMVALSQEIERPLE